MSKIVRCSAQQFVRGAENRQCLKRQGHDQVPPELVGKPLPKDLADKVAHEFQAVCGECGQTKQATAGASAA